MRAAKKARNGEASTKFVSIVDKEQIVKQSTPLPFVIVVSVFFPTHN